MTNKEKNFVSAVVYLHNDGARAAEFCAMLVKELDARFDQYELVAVDDACTDDTIPPAAGACRRHGQAADHPAHEPLPGPGILHECGAGRRHR